MAKADIGTQPDYKKKGDQVAKYTTTQSQQSGRYFVSDALTGRQEEFATLEDLRAWSHNYSREWLAVQIDLENHLEADPNLEAIGLLKDRTVTATISTSTSTKLV